jgi:hypothetical protein
LTQDDSNASTTAEANLERSTHSSMHGPINAKKNEQVRSGTITIIESAGDSAATVRRPSTLPKWIEMKSRKEVDSAA